MDDTHNIEVLRSLAVERRDAAIQQANEEFARHMRAIDELADLYYTNPGSDSAIASDRSANNACGDGARYDGPRLIDQIREAVSHLNGGVFSVEPVAEYLEEHFGYDPSDRSRRASLSSTMRRLATEHNELSLVKAGSGRRPHLYRRVQKLSENDVCSENSGTKLNEDAEVPIITTDEQSKELMSV
jgi:hypothetical protein